MKKPSYISTGYFSTNFFEKTIRSKHYDDIYFSPENGEAESEYVFLKANKLQERFSKISNFTIAELGFGTGLNFILTWKLFNNLKRSKDFEWQNQAIDSKRSVSKTAQSPISSRTSRSLPSSWKFSTLPTSRSVTKLKVPYSMLLQLR